jgi:hypothetical protein
MAYKMKGPSMYPNYRGKSFGPIKVNREDTSNKDGSAKSSPFQMHDGKKHKATATHFADGTKKTKRDKFNDSESPVKPTDEDMAKYSDLEKHDDDRVDPDAPGTPGTPGYEPPVKRSDLDAKGKKLWDSKRKKKTTKDKPVKDKEYWLNKGMTPKDADLMIKNGAQ